MIAMQHINDHIVPITRFNKGEANKIFDEVSRDGFRYVVKNNQVKCILISPEAYDMLIDEIEDHYDSRLIQDRLLHDEDRLVSMKDMADKYKISKKDIEDAPDVVFE
ncbi:MAG: type II toxin-antitoxin system Phd/YefM family antitoxin [Lachnospiraceae bacterium]|nr:type II toxin-antitoxin system Phd/YefM family antitoxin [Lachnospiraceae bacterium]